jgi:hypothetical protein
LQQKIALAAPAQSASQWEARPIPEELYRILLTNKKQGNLG